MRIALSRAMPFFSARSLLVCLGTLVLGCQSESPGGGGTDQEPMPPTYASPAAPGSSGTDPNAPLSPAPNAPTDVHGRILTASGAPVVGAQVRVADKAIVTTDATGAFQVADVARPYDLTFYQKLKTSDAVHAYVGLTRVDPMLDGEKDLAGDAAKTASVTISASSCNWSYVALAVQTAEGRAVTTILPCPVGGPVAVPVASDTAKATVRALQWSGPVPQYAEAAIMLDVAHPASIALALAAAPMTTVTLAPKLPAPFIAAAQAPVARFPDGAVVTLDQSAAGAPAVVPLYPTATASISAIGWADGTPNSPLSTWLAPVDAHTTNLALEFATPPTLTDDFKIGDAFTWPASGLLVSNFSIRSSAARATPLTVRVTTAGTSAKVPDLTPFALTPLVDAEKPLWRITTNGPMKTVDDYASGAIIAATARTPERAVTP